MFIFTKVVLVEVDGRARYDAYEVRSYSIYIYISCTSTVLRDMGPKRREVRNRTSCISLVPQPSSKNHSSRV